MISCNLLSLIGLIGGVDKMGTCGDALKEFLQGEVFRFTGQGKTKIFVERPL